MQTAVILAARKEADSKIPYPLLPYEGKECILDRTLSILRELGFGHIVIVCGYRKDLFEPYAAVDVSLLFNEDYEFTSSMASLARVREVVDDDFLLLEGDTFYEKYVIEQLVAAPYPDCMAITEESGNGDEAFVETYKGFVTKITKDKHQIVHYDGELLGLMRISQATFRKMLNLWDTSRNLYLNYEYVFFDATSQLDRPCLVFQNLIWGDVDCKKDFHKLKNYIAPRLKRKEDPFNHANLIEHLSCIFPDVEVSKAEISQIGGLSNKNFKVILDGQSYVLRVPGNGAEGMVDRACEDENSAKASKLAVTPSVRYFNRETGIKLVDYISGAETLNPGTIQRKENIVMVADILRTLHSSNVRFKNDFNVFRELLSYESLLAKGNGVMFDGYDEVRDKIFSLEDRLNEYGVELKPCHNDMVAENYVKSDSGRLYLIDWEYSGMNDPHWDFASLFNENSFSQDNREFFLHQYFGDEVPRYTREKILIYEILMDVLWAIWAAIKEAAGDDFGTYGADRFRRAVSNLKTL